MLAKAVEVWGIGYDVGPGCPHFAEIDFSNQVAFPLTADALEERLTRRKLAELLACCDSIANVLGSS